MGLSLGSILPAAATLASSAIGAYSASKAADAQTSAADRAAELQREMYYQNREDLAPYRQSGTNALSGLWALMQDPNSVTKMPGYQFRLDEGVKALDRGAAARGMLNSGASGKALMRYGQDYASSEYGQNFNRLAALAGVGQTATGQGVAAGQSAAGAMGNAYLSAGNARGSAYSGTANAVNSAMNNGLFLYGAQNGWFK